MTQSAGALPARLSYTPEQKQVIEAPNSARLVVNAGPGTGKTAVACARVAYLVKEANIPPSSIWLVSFTRTATKELRDRIYAYVGADAHGINIATLDSQAFSFVQGFADDTSFRSYDENIVKVRELLDSNHPEIVDYLDTIQHLFVDEAQDVVAERATLIETLISKLPDECGVTILCDEAQAIYGFSLDEEQRTGDTTTLPERLRKEGFAFESCELEEIHRTSSASLLKVFRDTRKLVLDKAIDPSKKLSRVRKDIELSAGTNIGRMEQERLRDQSDLLVLFRRRGEALLASSFLSAEEISHRVRLSRTPPCLHSWLAFLFWDFTDKLLTKSAFDELTTKRMPEIAEQASVLSAWQLLRRFAGLSDTTVDMHKVRRILSRARPPLDFTSAETGSKGPILGTIHSSKGREAPVVHLMLPPDSESSRDIDEEARVLFVGATRAQQSLKVGTGYRFFTMNLPDGRAIAPKSLKMTAMVEIGLDGDIDSVGLTGKALFKHQTAVLGAQNLIWELRRKPTTLFAYRCPDKDWLYEIMTEDGKLVGHFTKRLNNDLWKAADLIAKRRNSTHSLPEYFRVPVIDIRTVVLAADDPKVEMLHEPFCRSGFMLAPVVCGLPTMFFAFASRRR